MHVIDADGNIYKINVVSSIPEGFTEIEIPEDLADQEPRHLEAIKIPAIEGVAPVEAVEAQPERWVKPDEDDLLEDPQDDTWFYVPAIEGVEAVEEVIAVPAYWQVQKRSTADRDRRNEVLDKLRQLRKPLLAEADIEINKLFDADADTVTWKAYRQALRDVTASFIKVDGDPKVSVDTIDLENFSWPTKPE